MTNAKFRLDPRPLFSPIACLMDIHVLSQTSPAFIYMPDDTQY